MYNVGLSGWGLGVKEDSLGGGKTPGLHSLGSGKEGGEAHEARDCRIIQPH